ncbi:hypothetical protein BC777_1113 [Yoonia maricola]|uniref:Uncharacterized protein n=1 Tax=Yoonia maricola TaxID=420999 RepID=A0A2M8WMV5_9RHOB|nr:hypothetical protein [Yoonia maricola]PJI92268.1 hypothetical protein BC777_1113 [Yoonia maricola]
MAFRNILDGAASFGAAFVTSAICGLPAWFTVAAVRSEIAPVWAYAAAAGLAVIGVILTVAFIRKGSAGVAPTRQRRR